MSREEAPKRGISGPQSNAAYFMGLGVQNWGEVTALAGLPRPQVKPDRGMLMFVSRISAEEDHRCKTHFGLVLTYQPLPRKFIDTQGG